MNIVLDTFSTQNFAHFRFFHYQVSAILPKAEPEPNKFHFFRWSIFHLKTFPHFHKFSSLTLLGLCYLGIILPCVWVWKCEERHVFNNTSLLSPLCIIGRSHSVIFSTKDALFSRFWICYFGLNCEPSISMWIFMENTFHRDLIYITFYVPICNRSILAIMRALCVPCEHQVALGWLIFIIALQVTFITIMQYEIWPWSGLVQLVPVC